MTTGARAWALFAVFACAWFWAAIHAARAKPFWHDEIFTILHADLPSVAQMWAAGIDGFDLSPPLNTWLTRGVHELAGVGPVATRLPPMAGYLLMSVVIFHMLRKRAGTGAALAGALLPCFTAAYRYAYEARAYGLMIGLFALALFAWTEAARGARRPLNLVILAAALSASLLNHYYGVLAFIPIAAGEAVRALERRQPDVPVLTAIFLALCSGAVLWPLAAAAGTQRTTFWSSAGDNTVMSTYEYVFAPLLEVHFAIAGAAVVALALWSRRKPAPAPRRVVPAHEATAIAIAILIPALGMALAATVTGVFVPRYALAVVVGVSLAVPLLVWRFSRPPSGAEWLLCAVLAVSFARAVSAPYPPLSNPYTDRPLLDSALRSGAPVVVTGNIQFLQLWYYAPPAEKGRMRYLADVEQARKHLGFDTVDLGYLALRRWTAVPVENYADYTAAHQEFRVYVAGGGWLLPCLESSGAQIHELGREPGGQLLSVRLP